MSNIDDEIHSRGEPQKLQEQDVPRDEPTENTENTKNTENTEYTEDTEDTEQSVYGSSYDEDDDPTYDFLSSDEERYARKHIGKIKKEDIKPYIFDEIKNPPIFHRSSNNHSNNHSSTRHDTSNTRGVVRSRQNENFIRLDTKIDVVLNLLQNINTMNKCSTLECNQENLNFRETLDLRKDYNILKDYLKSMEKELFKKKKLYKSLQQFEEYKRLKKIIEIIS